jgi:nicotinamidase-related amidase
MYFGVENESRRVIQNNVLGLAKSAKLFNVPCILTTVAADTFSGSLYSRLQDIYPEFTPIDRTSINSWEDENVKKVVQATGRKKILISGLWTEACVAFPALSMKYEGYDVYVVTDACGSATKDAHDIAILRMVQMGVVPMTWMQTTLEWQRNWNNLETYDGVMDIMKEYSGAYGLGIEYAETMVENYKRNHG